MEIISPANLRVPHSVVLFLSGLALGRVGQWVPDTEFGRTVADFMAVDPHIIFWVLLPALLYEDASGVKWHVMKKVLPSALLLAVPGVIVNALLTGTIIKGLFSTIDWTWDAAFLLGTILSATDPVAVVGALHELAAPDRLSLLISGESLFNDGSAVVIFGLFWDSARGVRELSPGYSIAYFIRLACGGPLLGLAFAFVAFEWLKQTRRFSIEILVIVVTVYGSFFVAEHSEVKVSGVLAVVIFGFFMAARGHFALNHEESERHHSVIRFLALLSNEAIFVLAGVVSFKVLLHGYSAFQMRDWFELVLLYFIIHGTRALILALSFPLLRRWGYGCSVKEALICLFGGLRGAVGLAMALMVEHDPRLDDATRGRIAFHTSGIVLATLLINGTLITPVYKRLNLYQKAQHHAKLMRMALTKADASTQRRSVMFEQHWFFHNCLFTELFEAVPNLVQAAEELEHKRGGHGDPHSASEGHGRAETPTAGGTKRLKVNDVMNNIAQRLGSLSEEGLHDRYMQKLRYRRRWVKSATNVFIPTSLEQADQDENANNIVIGLAMRMANLEAKQKNASNEVANFDKQKEGDANSSRQSTPGTEGAEGEEPAAAPALCPAVVSSTSLAPPGVVPSAPEPVPEDSPLSAAMAPTDFQMRSKELKPPPPTGIMSKPMQAWATDSDTPKNLNESPKTRRPGSRVQFAEEEANEVAVEPVLSARSSRTRSTRTRTIEPSVTALPSELGERDNRLLYMQLLEEGRNRAKEMRLKSKQLIPEMSSTTDESVDIRSPTPLSSRRSAPARTNLQAQRIDALFQDTTIQHIGSAITMAMVAQELKKAEDTKDPRAKALARWKIAKTKVFWALRKIERALEEHRKLMEAAPTANRMISMSRSKTFSNVQVAGDSASMVEVHHMILNTTRCAYQEMYEAQSLPEGPFRVLMESLELQEEAIDGELQSAPVAPTDHELDLAMQKLPSRSHADQMSCSFMVSWLYIAERKNRAWDKGYFSCLQVKVFRLSKWLQMQHDVLMMLAFIMTAETIAEELEVIQDFEEQIKKPMLQVTERARAWFLYRLMCQNPAMFFLFEHVLCLRLMLDFQKTTILELVNDGLLNEEDAEDLIHRVIDPVATALERYVPTREQCRMVMRQCVKGGKIGRIYPSDRLAEEDVFTEDTESPSNRPSDW